MPSSVCQGLQSCLEPCEMEPRVLSLKLALQEGSNFPQPSPTTDNNTNTNSVSLSSLSGSLEEPITNHECHNTPTESKEGSGWSVLQIPSQSTDCHNKTEESVYVHPTVKRSSSFLSEKSLEMCTESLGSETGSNAGDSTDDISLFSFEATTCFTRNSTTHFTTTDVTTTVASYESRRVNRALNFPPPLTSITDLGGVKVRPRREGGRLILEAIASPFPCPYFRAEHKDGRLTLRLFESFSDSEDEVCDIEEVVEENEDENEKSIEECGAEDSEAEEECVENVEEEMGVTKFSRPTSCKESGKREIFGDGMASLTFPLFLSVSE
ncbi:hypothetical protein PHAVU_001G150800 [Phaseolus vulgaris]|uniref:FAF domain-containing protein n=1 Tax=Phaseolus vulgaris TaxID=3885 RepID=V7CZS5_PHAVU|nr:hypothetical protein PHAVU_001G150800g [Phaseolus vulgaris]ESW34416.1 hypothetical protein PHAVU_001G150800g [Phaseolus vulgaris]